MSDTGKKLTCVTSDAEPYPPIVPAAAPGVLCTVHSGISYNSKTELVGRVTLI